MNKISNPGLVLNLPLYELDGAALASRDAYGHGCAVEGAGWTPRGFSFDGSDDRLVVPDAASLDITGGITLEAWVNPASLDSTGDGLLYKPNVYGLDVASGGGIRFALDAGGGLMPYDSDAGEVFTGAWWHLSGCYDGRLWRIFKNGFEVKRGLLSGSIQTSANGLKIGEEYSSAYNLHGWLGEVRIYNRALAPGEVQQNYLATRWRYR